MQLTYHCCLTIFAVEHLCSWLQEAVCFGVVKNWIIWSQYLNLNLLIHGLKELQCHLSSPLFLYSCKEKIIILDTKKMEKTYIHVCPRRFTCQLNQWAWQPCENGILVSTLNNPLVCLHLVCNGITPSEFQACYKLLPQVAWVSGRWKWLIPEWRLLRTFLSIFQNFTFISVDFWSSEHLSSI